MSTHSSPPEFSKVARVEPVVSFAKPVPESDVRRPGTGVTALMLARYLVGRAVAARVSATLWIVGAVVLLGAVGLWFAAPHWLGVVVGLFGLAVLGLRAMVMLILGKIMAVGRLGASEARITKLVRDTGGDLRRELRRIGLPGSTFGMPLLVVRLMGRRRAQTFERMRRFDVGNVVPAARRAELEFIVRNDVLRRGRR